MIDARIRYGQRPSKARRRELISTIRQDLFLVFLEESVIEALLEFAQREDILAGIGEEIMQVAGLLTRISSNAAVRLLAAEDLTAILFFKICEGSRIADHFGLEYTVLETCSDHPREIVAELGRVDSERMASQGISLTSMNP
jgi:hypothetical protein